MALTTNQVAKILKISAARVIRMTLDGRFGTVERFGEKNYSFTEEQVAFVKSELANDSRSNLANRTSSAKPRK